MPRSAGPLRTLLLVLAAAVAGLLLGLGAFSVATAVGSGRVQDLGDPVRLDPARVTVTPAPTPTPVTDPRLNPPPEQVVPAAPSPATADMDDTGATDDDGDDDPDDD
jgi:hypothetical protein